MREAGGDSTVGGITNEVQHDHFGSSVDWGMQTWMTLATASQDGAVAGFGEKASELLQNCLEG